MARPGGVAGLGGPRTPPAARGWADVSRHAYPQRLDEKGRLILPAKFRDELAGGVVITKGQERCLYVFPTPEFQRIAGQLREQPMTHKAARAYSRVFFASAHDEVPDKQGRVTIPAAPAGIRGAQPGVGRHRRQHPGGDLGQAGLGHLPRGERRRLRRHRGGGAARRSVGRVRHRGPRNPGAPRSARRTARSPAAPVPGVTSPVPGMGADGDLAVRRRCCRQAHGTSDVAGQWGVDMGELRGTHVPVLLERTLELLAPALGRPGRPARPRRRHARSRRARRGGARRRIRPTVARSGSTATPRRSRTPGERLAPVRRTYASGARRLRRAARRARPARHRGGRRGAVRPRRLLAAARRAGPGLRVRPATRRWTCGWTRRGGRRPKRSSTRTSAGQLARVLRVYGEEKFATRIASAIVRERERNRITSSRARLAELVRDAIPAAARRTGGQSGQAHVPGIADRGQRGAGGAGGGAAGGAGRARPGGRIVVLSYHSLEDRITKRALADRARVTGPIDLPVELPGTGPTLRLLNRGESCPARRRWPRTRGPRRCGCGPRNGSSPEAVAREQRHRRVKALHQPVRATGVGPGTARAAELGDENRGRGHDRQQARTAVGGPDPWRSVRYNGISATGGNRRRGSSRRAAALRPGVGAAPSAPRLRVAPPPPVSGPRAPFVALDRWRWWSVACWASWWSTPRSPRTRSGWSG